MSQSSLLTDFGLKILRSLPQNKSQIISPLAISTALGMIYHGANGDTKSQILDALGGVKPSILQPEEEVHTYLTNRIFAKKDYKIKEAYSSDIMTKYEAKIESIDFDEGAAKKINEYMSGITTDKISDIITNDDLLDVFSVLVNSMEIQGDWQDKFEEVGTRMEKFWSGEGVAREIPFLTSIETHKDYSEDDTFRVLSLPYADTSFSFVIMLPKERFGLAKAVKTLTPSKFQSLIANLTNSYINVHIPKFHIDKTTNLQESMEKLGIIDIFRSFSDLSDISKDLRITHIIHHSVLKIDENGTNGSKIVEPSDKVEMMIMADPIDFKVDHPFLFAVLKDDYPVFMGSFY